MRPYLLSLHRIGVLIFDVGGILAKVISDIKFLNFSIHQT